MALGYRLINKHAALFGLVLFTAVTGLAFAAQTYDANHDDKLEPPTPEQTERALEAGERFQYQLIPPPLAGPPMTTIPESYTAQTEPERVLAEPWDPYDNYLWRWGPRAFWPCEQFDPFHRFSSRPYSVPPWKDKKHDGDYGQRWGSFDMWCPPAYGPISTHPRR
ncbi:hypothetical protein ACFL3A_02955 [Pseudomonadota bacterium]